MYFFPGCAQAGYPGVYAEVSSVLDWVNSFVSLCESTDPTPTNEPPTGCGVDRKSYIATALGVGRRP